MESGTPIVVALGVSGIFALVGIGLLAWWLVSRRRVAASQAWPAAQGQIAAASLHSYTRSDSDGNDTTYYEPKIEYAYTVGGQPLTGKRVAFGAAASTSRARAEQIVSRYAPGAAVAIYYNPERPQEAVLERSVSNMTGALLAGIMLLGGAQPRSSS
jgi:uncharacterized protein DUF3592